MADRPGLLLRLLESRSPRDEEEAWARLVEAHTGLLLRTARYFGGDEDAVMDRYAFMLEQLRRDRFSRLRAYRPEDGGGFEVWLVAVARRLCLDHHRTRYGRTPSDRGDEQAALQRAGRRRLVDLLGEAIDPSLSPDAGAGAADQQLARQELARALAAVLETLDARDRLLLHFLFEEELTAREIALQMRFPTQFHVYRRRNQVLALLRTRLRGRGVAGPEP
jgi:RNA polymerase sigma factor (sigma-70 family)